MESVLEYLDKITEDTISKMVFSSPKDKESAYKKIVIQRKEGYYQIEKFTQKQVFHENVEDSKLIEVCESILNHQFFQVNAWGENKEYSLKVTKKGKILYQKNASQTIVPQIQPHNRKKQYLLQEGCSIPPLVDMGIFTKEGNVVNAMYDKFKQINKFIEIIEDAIKKSNLTKLNIIDFGCGKSYLTFVVYYYLTEIRKMDVHMIGLDLKEEVIRKCRETAEKYGYDNLHFEIGDIKGYHSAFPIDMVISLHACDTATDFALYHAVRWNAKIILSVPCCQHEIAEQMEGDSLILLQRYGIVKERMAALMTDAIRCNLLTSHGYKTQLLEFVDLSHTPKNLLIRAIKSNISNQQKETAKAEVEEAVIAFHLNPTLLNLFADLS